ncbi:hypothetical protein [Methylobacterium tarhaniae]|uniref:hypothetical protein n=1 Tax=Methylobacterium tarhaniae TaxID=1187852 RepID=UPI003D08E37E
MVGPAEARIAGHHGPAFTVGQDGDGRWLAVAMHGSQAGVFPSQHAAMTYAEMQTHHRRGSIRLLLAPSAFDR